MDLPDDNTPPKNLEEDLAAQATETDAPTAACGEDEAEEEAVKEMVRNQDCKSEREKKKAVEGS